MVNFTVLAGGLGASIASYLFNSDTGTLSFLKNSTTGENPTWLALHPTNASILYAVNEIELGMVQSFVIGVDGQLSDPLSTVPSEGNDPVHIQTLSTDEVVVVNYGSGNARILKLTEDPAIFSGDSSYQISFPGGPSHPSQVVEIVAGQVFVPDVATEKIWILNKEDTGFFVISDEIMQPEGYGPRHIALSGEILFTLHETNNILTTQKLDEEDRTGVISSLSTLPDDVSSTAQFEAGEILIPPTSKKFPRQFVYCSNRNVSPNKKDHNPNGDTVAIFSFDESGNLKLENQIYTGIIQPRGLAFSGSPSSNAASANDGRAFSPHGAGDAEFLAIGGEDGEGGVAIFRRTEGGKNLQFVAREMSFDTRSSFVWI